MADERTDQEKASDLVKLLGYLKTIRQPFEAMVDNVITYVNHSRRKVGDKDGMKGQRTGVEIYDGTALKAKNLLVDGMVGYMCSRSLRWFSCSLPGKFKFPRSSVNLSKWTGKRMDDMPEVREWLDDMAEAGYRALNYSNFYDVIPEFIGDGAVPGTAHMISEEDEGRGQIIFMVPHYRECYIAEDRFGRIDTFFRIYKLNLRQLVDKFGIEKLTEIDYNFPNRVKANPYEEVEILKATLPRKDLELGRIDKKNKPIASYWVWLDKTILLEESGYDSMPSVSWRWRKNNDEWYGRSPAWDAYVEIMTSQQVARTNLIAAQKMAEPPMVGMSDLRGSVHDGPKAWTWVDDMEQAPKPMMTGIQLPYSVEMQERIDKAIREHFHVDFFLMLMQATINKQRITATQVVGMQGEQAAVLGTRMGNLESEGFDPILDRVYDIEGRAGRLPNPPDVVLEAAGGQRMQMNYLGPLAEAQKRLSKTRSLEAGLQYAATVSNYFPDATDKINSDAVMETGLMAYGFPAECINDDETVAERRKIRARQQDDMKTVESLPKIAKAAASAGKAAQTGSPLNALLESMGVKLSGKQPGDPGQV